ncbi:MAG: diadenylate cyclase CdaA [Clostridia bacterium]|nr:diadenylate cyclase CdaA [Clostridia bacterium]
MNDIIQTLQDAWWTLTHRAGFLDILDILLLAIIIYEVIKLVRHTRGSGVLKGLLFVTVIILVSRFLGLISLNWLVSSLLSNGPLVLIVLFQPEIRHALEQLGRGTGLEKRRKESAEQLDKSVQELVNCALALSKRRVGALIVFEQKTGLQDIIDTGTTVDGEITAALLENIFEPNTPLHDGAVIVRGSRVVAAACILNLTENRNVDRELGTRHRAALGVSETTDAVALVVSEETGIISVARDGVLERKLDRDSLTKLLEGLYAQKTFSLRSILQFRKKTREGNA